MPWPYQQQQMYGMGQAPRGYGGLGAMQQYGMDFQQQQQQRQNPDMERREATFSVANPQGTGPESIDGLGTAPPGGKGQQPGPNYPMYGGLGGVYGGYGDGYGGGSGGLGGYGGYPSAPQNSPYGTTWQDYRGGANRPFNYPPRQPMYGGGDPRMGGYGGGGGMMGGYGGGMMGGYGGGYGGGGGGMMGGYGGMMPPRPQPSPYGGLTQGFGQQMFGADPYAYAQQLGTLGAYQPQMPAQTDLQNLMGYQQQTFGQQVWPTTAPPVATTPDPGATTTPGPVATTQGPGPTTTQGPGPARGDPQYQTGYSPQRPQQQYGYGRPPMYGGGYGGYGGIGGMYGGAYGGYGGGY